MQISMIAAMANNRVIGLDNQMPWHLPADLAHFKRITLGKPVIMGRKTYESIGRALPKRPNIVISRDPSYHLADATVVNSCDAAIDAALSLAEDLEEVMIIGGGTIYQHFLSQAQCLYLTHINLDVDGDTQFPDYESVAKWREIESISGECDDKNRLPHTFKTLHRVAV